MYTTKTVRNQGVSSIMFLIAIFKVAALLMNGSSNYINSLTKIKKRG